ncbi:RagB/SusD family nutrient uptake outer membrane protein [Belliella kenyensis]|uniref:RagB/SusD family nutrient uptake outer membrane protein n=1 Tax=Belliella kenyensis TaxID=1472724 RepID=A0ABV8EHD8_9BACT|nr:RagB/SusD family nutrient uptake outer membrane protein [Belliella kenyensis]MCH7400985.1 RagB/SusD family nutrient uptake outer membrane protein [Belliella kenyensis]MDN3603983.1 RagB/SusD family nutrient uptake outer membrane protein [Belliella kenyensis]
MTRIRKIKNIIILSITMFVLFGIQSCESFLDVVPDNVATIENAFKLRNEAEKYLFTLYSFMPRNGNTEHNIGLLAGDELWIPYEKSITSYAFEIARGNQRRANPFMDVWSGRLQGGGPQPSGSAYGHYRLFTGIRHCNIFLENLQRSGSVPDLGEIERRRWIGEAEFLKAYYHYYLLRMYGPIPIIDTNVPIDAPEDEVNVKRRSVDDVVNYIADLLEEAADKLPMTITDRTTEMGRLTRPAAMALRAKLLVMAASPLFNGNSDYATLTNKDGEQLFNTSFEMSKWERALAATTVAVADAEAAGHFLYQFGQTNFNLTDTTITELSIRQAVTERYNPEHVWANPVSVAVNLQRDAMAPLMAGHDHNHARKILSAPIKIARQFYTKNGVPINEDRTLDFSAIDALRTATREERFYIEEGFRTARINFDREPRFYASLGFDGAKWYKYDSPTQSDEGTYVLRAKYPDYAGSSHAFHTNETGYYIKKLVDWNQAMTTSSATYRGYAWPEIRMSDLYLLHAEAMNEVEGSNPTVIEYIDRVRARAGLEGVVYSWQNFSNNPNKYSSKDGLRDIIHQERMIELAFEGQRFWDLRRWKKANSFLNQPITGWNVRGENEASYYQIVTLFSQRFVAPRDYFWPIGESAIIQNPNLVQNLGW